jgi:uncharacterized protein
MTIKEAILKVLENEKKPLNYMDVYNKINEKKFIDWSNAKTPSDTVAAQLGSFIRQNDSRVKRIKSQKGFLYYLSKFENDLDLSLNLTEENWNNKSVEKDKYQERDLHILLSSFLINEDIRLKTIFHEKSSNSNDTHQKWIHPDMIGVKFNNTITKSN